MNMKTLTRWLASALVATFVLPLSAAEPAARWSPEKANTWYREKQWLVGCNFGPSTAINQLEMWQADSFDPTTLDRELGWAESLGFNSLRVFLHDIPWQQDSKGFCERIDKFLELADKHHIGVMFVFFDSCWEPYPKAGKQRAPKPHVHNSGWVQSPGLDILKDPAKCDALQPYVQGILRRFGNDQRVQVWDLFNEPDNRNDSSYGKLEPANKGDLAMSLLKKTVAWAREANPSQPLTVGVWGDAGAMVNPSGLTQYILEISDVISFHNYGNFADMKKEVEALKKYNRPLLCTEYMARPTGSTFQGILPYLREMRVSAYNWGFVAGKTQTIYPWDSWKRTYTAEPPLWFHDIFRADGTAYQPEEVRAIRRVTGKQGS
jgi:hypothetical protein